MGYYFDGARVRVERERAGLSRPQFAARTRRSVGLLTKIERCTMKPSVDSLAAFADALDVSPVVFFGYVADEVPA